MEVPIIDPNNRDEQLYYPPINYIITKSETPQYDEYFKSQTIVNIEQNPSRVIMIDSNNFIINKESCFKTLTIIYIITFIILFCISLTLFCIGIEIKYILMIPGPLLIFVFLSALIFGCLAYKIYLKIEADSILLIKKSFLKSRFISFSKGQLERAEIVYQYDPDPETSYSHGFYFCLVPTKGSKIKLFRICSKQIDVDLKGLKYFADQINYHIKNNMQI